MALSFPSLILLLSIALSSSLDLALFPTSPVSNTYELQSQFNHQLKMTAGTEREEKGIVRVCVCEEGGYRKVMRQRKRGGAGGGACDRRSGERMRKGDRRRGGLLRPMKVGVKKSKAS